MDGRRKYKLVFSKIPIRKDTKINKKNIIQYFNLFLLKTIKEKINLFYPEVLNFDLNLYSTFNLDLFSKEDKSYFFCSVLVKEYFLILKDSNNVLLEIFLNGFEDNKTNISIFFKCNKESVLDILNTVVRDIEKLSCKKYVDVSVEKNNLIKSALHLETQKFGRKPRNVQETIENQNTCVGSNKNSMKIEIIGLDFQPSHYHALNAIQKLLEETNYNGNIKGTYLSRYSNSFKFEGTIPRIKFSRSDFLKAYGVTKFFSARNKMEFSGKESRIALEALYYLGTQPHLIISTRKRKEQGKEVVDRYQTVSPLLRICEGWEGLTPFENKSLDEGQILESLNGKHRGFVIEPCPLLIDQIDTYFVLKPANIYQEIKLKFPNASKFAYTFIDWIVKEATLKKMFESNKDKYWPNKIEIGFESLVYALRMNSYIKSRNWKRIDIALNRCVEIAISLGWLLQHESVEGKTIKRKETFYLNKRKFEKISKEKTTSHFH